MNFDRDQKGTSIKAGINTSNRLTNLRWKLGLSTLILILSSIPNWVGRASETNTLRFRGNYFDSQDYAVHLSMMQAGQNGDWTYRMRFTTEPHKAASTKLFYIFLGHISSWTGVPPESIYHLSRWLFGYLALFSIYDLCSLIIGNFTTARFAFILASMGSGLGMFQMLFGFPIIPISPIDFWLVDLYVFFSLSVFPHFAFQIALMTIALALFLRYILEIPDAPNKFDRAKLPIGLILTIGSLSIITQLVNPIAFLGVDFAIFGAAVFNWLKNNKVELQQLTTVCILVLIQVPLLGYNYFLFSRDPVWSQFALQNLTLSPPPAYLLLGLGLLLPFATLGGIRGIQTRSPGLGALITWVAAGFIFAYLTLTIQRRFLLGMTIPVGILAVEGIVGFIKTRFTNLLIFSYTLLVTVSSIYLSLGSSIFIRTHPEDYYYPANLGSALSWLDHQALPDDFVMASARTGSITAQLTHLRVYIGHEMETINFSTKKSLVEAFYSGKSPEGWLSSLPIRWVIFGPYENELFGNFRPEDTLALVYERDRVKIYEVISR